MGGRVFECLVFSIKRVFKHWGVECLLVFKHWGVECSNTRLIKNTQTLNTRPPAKHFLNQKHLNTKHPKTLKPSLNSKHSTPRNRSDPKTNTKNEGLFSHLKSLNGPPGQ